jgi:hypothetical protein
MLGYIEIFLLICTVVIIFIMICALLCYKRIYKTYLPFLVVFMCGMGLGLSQENIPIGDLTEGDEVDVGESHPLILPFDQITKVVSDVSVWAEEDAWRLSMMEFLGGNYTNRTNVTVVG